MKRPAASEATSGAPTKKPAANKLTINAMVDDIKTAASSKDDEEENQLRDKGKAEKFGKLMKAGALPLAVVHMWQIESKKAQSQRQFQTNLINGLFNKQTDGSYKMNTESHQFKEYQKIYVQHVAKDKKKGMPRGIMLASVFHGDSRAMEASLAKGELQSHKDDAGMEYLSFRELQTMEVKTNERGETVEGSKKLKSQEAHTLAGLMSKMKWEWVCKKAGSGRCSRGLPFVTICHTQAFCVGAVSRFAYQMTPGCPPPQSLSKSHCSERVFGSHSLSFLSKCVVALKVSLCALKATLSQGK